jgi:hypothetical protein
MRRAPHAWIRRPLVGFYPIAARHFCRHLDGAREAKHQKIAMTTLGKNHDSSTLRNKPQGLLAKLKKIFVPMEDQWTWTTRDGDIFEDVAVEDIQADQVIFQHKFGKVRMPIAHLSADSQSKLERGFQAPVASNQPRRERQDSQVVPQHAPWGHQSNDGCRQ